MDEQPRAEPGGRLLGGALVAGGAMLFAAKGLFAKKLYALGVGVEALVTIRALLSLPLFWAVALARDGTDRIRATRGPAIAAAALAGFACYYVGALLDFQALSMIDASIERVLLFSYPAFVVLYLALRQRRRPEAAVLAAVGLTYLGIFLAVGGFDLAVLRANFAGALLVIGAALSYAAYFLIGERYTREIGSSLFTLFAMSAAALALAVHYLVRHGLSGLGGIAPRAWLLLLLIAVVCMFVPASMQAEGVRRVGAQRGSVISTIGPPTTIVLSWLLLGERMSGWQIAGVALIVGGILVLDISRRPAAR
ncbi:MAG: DMT family transporter [Steroidobacteraceae bacterium]